MKSILIKDNCWMTNTGEAFIDIGARALLEELVGKEYKIFYQSDMTETYMDSIRKRSLLKNPNPDCVRSIVASRKHDDCFSTTDIFHPDYVVLNGMYFTPNFGGVLKSILTA